MVAECIGPDAAKAEVQKVSKQLDEILKKKHLIHEGDVRKNLADVLHDTGHHEVAVRVHSDTALRAQVDNFPVVNSVPMRSIMATFADPIIILFLGGFFLAAAAKKYKLDLNLARVMLKPFGTNPKLVMLGLMGVTAVFSMFMSNTATTAMMLAILAPVLALFSPEDRGRTAFALAIPMGANIGGIGTPIGTPPNAIALKFMHDMGLNISFGKWMCFGVPFVLLMLTIAWLLLLKMFPMQQKSIKVEVGGKFDKSPQAIIVYITFAVTVFMWVVGRGFHGLDSNSIALIPICVFCVTGVITAEDLRQMSWEVLWLVAGGFALGLALQETGLAKTLVHAIPFTGMNIWSLMMLSGFICLFMATFMSNTATASLLMPVLGAVAASLMASGAIGTEMTMALLVCLALSSSLGMALPISTPPNALAYATGLVKTRPMARMGTYLCLIGLLLGYLTLYLLVQVGFF